jgi:signal transduction histidine kinase
MTSTTTDARVDLRAGPVVRAQPGIRLLIRLAAAAVVGATAVGAGLDPGAAAVVAVVAAALLLLVAVVERAFEEDPAPSSAEQTSAFVAEQRRGDAARILGLELAVDRLRSVLEALREGVVVVDGTATVVLANPEARQELRDPASPPVGKLLWDVLAPELLASARQAFAELGDEALGSDRPVRLPAIAFGRRIIDLTIVRVQSRESGQDFGAVFLFVDATRSHELAHLKDRFLSGISHELRTPLTNICAYAEILRHLMPGEASEWPEFVRIVHEESLQLSRVVDTVFDYAQLESGEAVFDVVACEPDALVEAACQRARNRAATAGLDLRCEVADGLPPVAADALRFGHALDHLLDNALKFTPRGGRVAVRAAIDPAGVSFRVDDSGPGIAAAERASVFEKFHQLGNHLTGEVAGPGLGLATTKAIVARLGGTIRCELSDLGGAAFVAVLPAAQPAVGAVRGAVRADAGRAVAHSS